VYAGIATGGRVQLYMHAFDSTEATVLKGTEDGRSPFFSPDGKWLAFYSGRHLKKIALPDGPA
jgi:eukaryotic-like serine/threonine-protein kinase